MYTQVFIHDCGTIVHCVQSFNTISPKVLAIAMEHISNASIHLNLDMTLREVHMFFTLQALYILGFSTHLVDKSDNIWWHDCMTTKTIAYMEAHLPPKPMIYGFIMRKRYQLWTSHYCKICSTYYLYACESYMLGEATAHQATTQIRTVYSTISYLAAITCPDLQ